MLCNNEVLGNSEMLCNNEVLGNSEVLCNSGVSGTLVCTDNTPDGDARLPLSIQKSNSLLNRKSSTGYAPCTANSVGRQIDRRRASRKSRDQTLWGRQRWKQRRLCVALL